LDFLNEDGKAMFVKYRCWFFVFLLTPLVSFATVTATLDRDQINQYESVNLTIASDMSSDQVPDLSALKSDFTIDSTAKGESIAVINGDVKRETQWVIALSPKRAGNLIIPALSFGNEKTVPIQLKVVDKPVVQNQSVDFFIETMIEPKEAYVEQPVVYTLQIWTSGPLANASFKPPTFADNSPLTPHDQERHFRSSRAGRQYEVIEKRYLFSPEKAGTLTINPPVLKAVTFDNDPFGSFYSRSSSQAIHLVGKPQTLTIKPKPVNWQGGWWLPASRLTVKDEWSRDLKNWRVGEPLTRTITVTGWGIAAEKLPDIKMDVVQALNSYPDKSQINNKIDQHGVVGTRQVKLALVPTQAGEWQLPAVKIPWWNVTSHKIETAEIPAITVTILPEVADSSSVSPKPPRVMSADNTQRLNSIPLDHKKNVEDLLFWQWLVLLLASFCVLSGIAIVILWRKLKGRQSLEKMRSEVLARSEHNLKQAKESIKQCCEKNDARATIDATLSWARKQWLSAHITSLNDVTNLIQYPPFAIEVAKLLAACYKQANSPWNAKQYWRVFQDAIEAMSRKQSHASEQIPPLYSGAEQDIGSRRDR